MSVKVIVLLRSPASIIVPTGPWWRGNCVFCVIFYYIYLFFVLLLLLFSGFASNIPEIWRSFPKVFINTNLCLILSFDGYHLLSVRRGMSVLLTYLLGKVFDTLFMDDGTGEIFRGGSLL